MIAVSGRGQPLVASRHAGLANAVPGPV